MHVEGKEKDGKKSEDSLPDISVFHAFQPRPPCNSLALIPSPHLPLLRPVPCPPDILWIYLSHLEPFGTCICDYRCIYICTYKLSFLVMVVGWGVLGGRDYYLHLL